MSSHIPRNIPLRNRIRAVVAGVVRRRLIAARERFLRTAHDQCRETQQATLDGLLALNGDSRFSQQHGLTPGISVDELRQRIPVTDYEFFRSSIDQMKTGDHQALLGSGNRLLMYAVTSGTTADSKLIPVTERFVEDYRRGWQHWGVGAFRKHQQLSLLRMVQLASSHNRWTTDDGIPCGNISGLAAAMQKKVVRQLYTIPPELASVKDPVHKRLATAIFALSDPFAGMLITANPSTLLALLTAADAATDLVVECIERGTLQPTGLSAAECRQLDPFLKSDVRRATELKAILAGHDRFETAECWPYLACLGVWTGGSVGSYVPALRERFGNIPIRDHGLHASEGRMTIPLDDETSAGVLDIESHFFEFIPWTESQSDNPTILQAHELEEGQEYFVLLTTASGLYRYNMFDVVRCTGFYGTTPLIQFLHKGAHISSITGEKITESQVIAGVNAAAEHTGVRLRQFTLTPVWGDLPGYHLHLQAASGTELANLTEFAEAADREIGRANCEYQEKRETGRLATVQCFVKSEDDWERFRQNRLQTGGGSEEQYKHPFLLPDAEFTGRFDALMGGARPAN